MQREQAGRLQDGEALAGVARHPADAPNTEIFEEASGFQQSNPLAWRRLPQPSWEIHTIYLVSTCVNVSTKEVKSRKEIRTMLSVFLSAQTKFIVAQKCVSGISRLQGDNGSRLAGTFCWFFLLLFC